MFKLNKKWVGFLLLSIPSNLFNLTIYYVINYWVTNHMLEWSAFFSFIVLLIFSYLTTLFFQEKIIDYTLDISYKNELKIIKVIRDSSFELLEKKGMNNFINVIDDIRYFLVFPGILSSTIYSLVTIFFGILYMFYLSLTGGIIFLFFVSLFSLVYFFLIKKVITKNLKLKKLDDKYYLYLNEIINGLKLLKINLSKNRMIFNDGIINNRSFYLQEQKKVLNFNLNFSLLSKYSLFLVLSIFLFILPKLQIISMNIVLSYIIIILFLTESINSLVAMQSFYSKAFACSNRIELFFSENFSIFDNNNSVEKGENVKIYDFQELTLKDICFNYILNDSDVFCLKNINLNIKKGEVIFFTGGNGSGKSTLIKILLGLYYAKSGSVEINGEYADPKKEEYKNLFSVIFTDNYNFTDNYFGIENNVDMHEIVAKMNLKNHVLNINDLFSGNFSKGQSKRISLIIALLEKRPILVLDEWAAEQDPNFRKLFYEEIIPSLKKQGKTIIAVTHDDAYFEYADRIIKFDYGEMNELPIKKHLN